MDIPSEKRQRPRGPSISGRLRSASDLCDDGLISTQEKGVLKDMIIIGSAELDAAFDAVEKGNVAPLKGSVCQHWFVHVMTVLIFNNGLLCDTLLAGVTVVWQCREKTSRSYSAVTLPCFVCFRMTEMLHSSAAAVSGHDLVGKSLDMGLLTVNDSDKLTVCAEWLLCKCVQ